MSPISGGKEKGLKAASDMGTRRNFSVIKAHSHFVTAQFKQCNSLKCVHTHYV